MPMYVCVCILHMRLMHVACAQVQNTVPNTRRGKQKAGRSNTSSQRGHQLSAAGIAVSVI